MRRPASSGLVGLAPWPAVPWPGLSHRFSRQHNCGSTAAAPLRPAPPGPAGHTLAVVYAWVCIAAICVTALLVCTHLLLERCAPAFSQLALPQRVATTYHAAYALCYTAIVFPTTYYAARLLFMPGPPSTLGFLQAAQKW